MAILANVQYRASPPHFLFFRLQIHFPFVGNEVITSDLLGTVIHLVEPGSVKPWLLLTLFLGGLVLIGLGNLTGLALVVDALSYLR